MCILPIPTLYPKKSCMCMSGIIHQNVYNNSIHHRKTTTTLEVTLLLMNIKMDKLWQ